MGVQQQRNMWVFAPVVCHLKSDFPMVTELNQILTFTHCLLAWLPLLLHECRYGMTAHHYAAAGGHTQLVEYLLTLGAQAEYAKLRVHVV